MGEGNTRKRASPSVARDDQSARNEGGDGYVYNGRRHAALSQGKMPGNLAGRLK